MIWQQNKFDAISHRYMPVLAVFVLHDNPQQIAVKNGIKSAINFDFSIEKCLNSHKLMPWFCISISRFEYDDDDDDNVIEDLERGCEKSFTHVEWEFFMAWRQ